MHTRKFQHRMVTFAEDARLTAEYWLGKFLDERLAASALLIKQKLPAAYQNRKRTSVTGKVVTVPWLLP